MANETFYVSKSTDNDYAVGSDSNDGLTIGAPVLTLDKAGDLAMAATGDVVIIINDGIYIGTDIDASAQYWVWGGNPMFDTLLIKPAVAGNVTIISGVITAGIRFSSAIGWNNSNIVTIQDLIFGQSSAGEGGTDVNYLIWFKGGTTTAPVFNLTRLTTKNQIFYGINIDAAALVTVNITDCIHESDRVSGRAYVYSPSHDTGNLTIDGLTISNTQWSNSGSGLIYWDAGSAGVGATVKNVTATLSVGIANAASNGLSHGIFIANCDDAWVLDCDITMINPAPAATWSQIGIRLFCNDAGLTAVRQRIEGSTVRCFGGNASTGAGFGITVGGDGGAAQANKSDDSAVLNCTFIGDSVFVANNGHGIGVVENDDCIVSGCTVSYADIGILAKLTATCNVIGNLVFKCGGGVTDVAIYNKGGTNDNFFFNTIIIDADSDSIGFLAAISGATNSTGLEFKDNLIVMTATGTQKIILINTDQTGTFDYNHYYIADGVALTSQPFFYQSTAYTTLAAWIAARETNGVVVTASPVNTDYTLKAGATGLGDGESILAIAPRIVGFNGQPFPRYGRDIGGAPSSYGALHPLNI